MYLLLPIPNPRQDFFYIGLGNLPHFILCMLNIHLYNLAAHIHGRVSILTIFHSNPIMLKKYYANGLSG